ncbi:hypothetical protein PGTUg99_009191 [Puccinia graminis f. sp. tritici]|uniref:Uncharacterized protein n=1 Tax=Puccinia graminis f. sp. tritici TaxID=56615 RepID=A0A5B0P5X9_PUCGR|nr:hypothetical protein PGTUg99_009191 [Puccinia graminis f. sp. tritici]
MDPSRGGSARDQAVVARGALKVSSARSVSVAGLPGRMPSRRIDIRCFQKIRCRAGSLPRVSRLLQKNLLIARLICQVDVGMFGSALLGDASNQSAAKCSLLLSRGDFFFALPIAQSRMMIGCSKLMQ